MVPRLYINIPKYFTYLFTFIGKFSASIDKNLEKKFLQIQYN